MSNSLIEAAGKFNFHLKIGCPKKYSPNKKILNWAKKNKVHLLITNKPHEALENSDCVMTDKWVSMNDNVNKKLKKINLDNTLYLAKEFEKKGAFVVVLSTNLVFDGDTAKVHLTSPHNPLNSRN